MYRLQVVEIDSMNLASLLNILLFTDTYILYTEISNNKIKKATTIIFSILSFLPLMLAINLSGKGKILCTTVSMLTTLIHTIKFLRFKNIKNINIIPISRKIFNIFIVCFGLFTSLIIYLLEIDPLSTSLLYNLLTLAFELILMLYVKEKDDIYDKIYLTYYMSDYITKERDEFARVLHDDIIQDIFATKNFLSLNNPNIELSKNTLSSLEVKARNIMKYYQSNILENASIDLSLEEIVSNIENLYKNKEINGYLDVSEEVKKLNNKRLNNTILLISREIINNIYKHSDGTYYNYKLFIKGNQIQLEVESDGANELDYNRIHDSKGGILLLTLLIKSNSGEIKYSIKDNVLYTKVNLEVENDENSIAWWS